MRTALVLLVALCAVPAFAQGIVKNPTALLFTCPDHATDTAHEVDIVDAKSGNVIQTLQVGDPPALANGDVQVTLNVQATTFGAYMFVVRAIGGGVSSVPSLPSAVWERAPGQPGRPRVP